MLRESSLPLSCVTAGMEPGENGKDGWSHLSSWVLLFWIPSASNCFTLLWVSSLLQCVPSQGLCRRSHIMPGCWMVQGPIDTQSSEPPQLYPVGAGPTAVQGIPQGARPVGRMQTVAQYQDAVVPVGWVGGSLVSLPIPGCSFALALILFNISFGLLHSDPAQPIRAMGGADKPIPSVMDCAASSPAGLVSERPPCSAPPAPALPGLCQHRKVQWYLDPGGSQANTQ